MGLKPFPQHLHSRNTDCPVQLPIVHIVRFYVYSGELSHIGLRVVQFLAQLELPLL